ncbi:MAG: hypothetical protein JJE03_04740 [Peptostreptococcaceae bacterium]|nr:hypothetical protein [Peptostreptococcaceae bacterium]
MTKLIDYNCKANTFVGITSEFAEENNLHLPEIYLNAEDLADISIALQKKNGNYFSVLPLDPSLISEAKGADIKFDQSNLGPRKNTDTVKTIEELLELPKIDFSKGRIAETLKAVTILKSKGYHPAIEITGPFSIINGLMDLPRFMMAFRKKGELIEEIFTKFNIDLVRYFLEANNAGCEIIFYEDPSVGINLLGPKYMKQVLNWSTIPLLKELDEKLDKNCLVYLCPKLSFALAGTDLIEWKKLSLEKDMPYHDAMVNSVGKVRFSGNRCRKNDKHIATGSFPYFELKPTQVN